MHQPDRTAMPSPSFIRLDRVKQTLSIFLMTLMATAAQAGMGERHRVGKADAALLRAPDSGAANTATVQAGSEVIELMRQDDWLRVSDPASGKQGWIKLSQLNKPAITAQSQPTSHDKRLTLRDIGLKQGITFEGGHLRHQRTLYFPLPVRQRLENVTVRLRYKSSPTHLKVASLRLDVQGIPQTSVPLPDDGLEHEMVVRVSPKAIQGEKLRLDLHATLMASDDRCLDERLSSNFLHIAADSSVEMKYAGGVDSLGDAWLALPQTVGISLPTGPLDAKAFSLAWNVMDLLYREGRQVRFTTLPEIADIVIAPRNAIESALSASAGAPGKGLVGNSNLILAHSGKHPFIAITEPFDTLPLHLLKPELRALGVADNYRLLPLDARSASRTSGSGLMALPLSTLGIDQGIRQVGGAATWWTTTVSPDQLPPHMRLDHLRMEFIAPPATEDAPYEIYAYLNDILVKTARLDIVGGRQHLVVPLPVQHQQTFNRIAFSLQRKQDQGDCRGNLYTSPFQFLPESKAFARRDDTPPTRFADLPTHLGADMDLYLSQDLLAQPRTALHALAALTAQLPFRAQLERIHFVAPNAVVKPAQRFVAIGKLRFEGADMGVQFDQGRIAIKDAEGATLLAASDLPKLDVAQLVRAGDAHGLWVRPGSEGLGDLREITLSQDDVAFIDRQGVVLTMNSREPTLIRVGYLDIESWLDYIERFRFWFIGLGWLLLTGVIVYLYRKAQMHRRAAEKA